MKRRCPLANDSDDAVGYGKPPKASQFKKGCSGNSRGRPRKPHAVSEVILKIANQQVLVTGKRGPKSLSMLELMLTQLGNQAAKGDSKSVKLFLEVMLHCPELIKPENLENTEAVREKLLALLKRHDN
jgi:malonyl CoA-acyl carrier protein transacylase